MIRHITVITEMFLNIKSSLGLFTFFSENASAVDRAFGYRSGQNKEQIIGICCFSAKHTTLRRKRNITWLNAPNQYHLSELSDLSTRGLLPGISMS